MSTIRSRVIVSKRHEWFVPTNGTWGASHTELLQALEKARDSYCRIKGLTTPSSIADDAIRVHCGDDEISISFTIELPVGT